MRMLAALLLLAACMHAQAAEPLALRTSIEANSELKWRPDGRSGLCPDILRALERSDGALKVSWSPQRTPQRRLVEDVARGRIDLACALGRTQEREERFAIPDVILYNNELVAAVRQGDPLQLASLAELARLPAPDVVLVNAGARLVARLREMGVAHVDEGGKNPQDNLRKLAAGRGRVYLYHEPGMRWEIGRAGLGAQLQVLNVALSTDAHYLLLSPQLPRATVQRITQALRNMHADGSLRAITVRWSAAPH